MATRPRAERPDNVRLEWNLAYGPIERCDRPGCSKRIDPTDPIVYEPHPGEFCSKDCAYRTVGWLVTDPTREQDRDTESGE